MTLLILILLAIAFLLRVDFIWYIIYVCLAIYAWGHWITPHLISRLQLKRAYQDHAFLGERVRVTLSIHNNSRLPLPWIQYVETVPPELKLGEPPRGAISLGMRKTRQISYDIRAMRRGYYRLGPLSITAGDVFGFEQIRKQFPVDHLTVYPRIIPLAPFTFPSKLPFGIIRSKQRLFEDPARPIGVRSYLSSDSQRHINWKVSAHANNLLVKTFEPAISLETTILLNLNANEYSRRFRHDGPEWAIVVAASLAAYLVSQRQAVGLATNGIDPLRQFSPETSTTDSFIFDKHSGRLVMVEDLDPNSPDNRTGNPLLRLVPLPITPRPGRAHLMKVLEVLARIEARNTESFAGWLPRACLNSSWGVTILAISPNAEVQICQTLHRLSRRGYNPALLITEPYVDFKAIGRRASQLGYRAYHIPDQAALTGWRQTADLCGMISRKNV